MLMVELASDVLKLGHRCTTVIGIREGYAIGRYVRREDMLNVLESSKHLGNDLIHDSISST
jgi:hypothetical protein